MRSRGACPGGERRLLGFALVTVLAMPVSSLACEICVEDQVAATYDHAVVAQAEAAAHFVLFTAVRGKTAGTASSQTTIRSAIASVAGVDRSSIRLSAAPPAVSFAWNPKGLASGAVLRAINKRLAGSGLALIALRTFGDRDIERLDPPPSRPPRV